MSEHGPHAKKFQIPAATFLIPFKPSHTSVWQVRVGIIWLTNQSLPTASFVKFNWNQTTLIQLSIVNSYFQGTMAEADCTAHSLKYLPPGYL